MIDRTTASEVVGALAPAARAFTKAQNKGLVWVSDEGVFQTHEMFDAPDYAAPKNPDQLRLV